ncbi:MAG: class I SAM-dependent methyltransferase [Rubrivivax sp.]
MNEPHGVAERYARRADAGRYSPLRPEVQRLLFERRQALIDLIQRARLDPVEQLALTEVGCGTGANLLELLGLGFDPARLTGIELLPQRLALARERLPAAVRLLAGDACEAEIAPASQDLVLQATVFSSLLDEAFRQRLADTMWRWLRPGGAVVWYDFTVDNPRNPDVRGVPLARVRALFPQGSVQARRVTLAPPLARAACRVHPWLHDALNLLPLLRTHVLAWVTKPR